MGAGRPAFEATKTLLASESALVKKCLALVEGVEGGRGIRGGVRQAQDSRAQDYLMAEPLGWENHGYAAWAGLEARNPDPSPP